MFARIPGVGTAAWRPSIMVTAGTDRRIPLNVVVTDKSGKPVAGLQQQDFTALDDKFVT